MSTEACCGITRPLNLFALLQINVLDRCRWESRGQLQLAIITWIERIYHPCQRRLGKLTPAEYEMLFTQTAAAACPTR